MIINANELLESWSHRETEAMTSHLPMATPEEIRAMRRSRDGDAIAISRGLNRQAPEEPIHGRYGTYTNHGCRCPLCYQAAQAQRAKWRRK